MDDARTFWWPVRVYYEDTDAGGIVYNANYLRFMERARTEWLRASGFEHDALREQGLQMIISRADIRFRAPARLDDQLQVGVQVTRLRRASLGLYQPILAADHRLLCEADVTAACVDVATLRPRPLPATMSGDLH